VKQNRTQPDMFPGFRLLHLPGWNDMRGQGVNR
jgi:hypothetical protein